MRRDTFLDTAFVKGKCRKLSPSWKGPDIGIKKLSTYLYRVKTKAAVMANHDRLKKCVDRDIQPDCPITERSSGALSPRGKKLPSPRLRLGVSLRLPCQTPLCPPRPREPL